LIEGARSIIQKITETDIIASVPMVVLLSQENVISDGWYSLNIEPDSLLKSRLEKTGVGTKLYISNAELVKPHTAGHPLESPNAKLKLFANSVRRCKWHAKLGQWHPKTHGPLPLLDLGAIDNQGGNVTKMRVLILRQYPEVITVYNQKAEYAGSRRSTLSRRQMNRNVTLARDRTEKENDKFAALLEKERIENLDQSFKKMAFNEIVKLTDGADLYYAIEQSKDPDGIFQELDQKQRDLFRNYKLKINGEIADKVRREQQAASSKKEAFVKFRICDLEGTERKIMSQPKAQHCGLLHLKAAFAEKLEPGSTLELENISVRQFCRDLMLAQGNATQISLLGNQKTGAKYFLHERVKIVDNS